MAAQLLNQVKQDTKPKPKLGLPKIMVGQGQRLLLGIALYFIAFFIASSLLSHIFNGNADQSLFEGEATQSIRESGREAENWMGYLGAWISHLLMFKGIGLAAFLIPVLMVKRSTLLTTKLSLWSSSESYKWSLFAIFWISPFFGYLVEALAIEDSFGYLCGSFGYELALILQELIGVGTIALLLVAGTVFLLFHFELEKGEQWKKLFFKKAAPIKVSKKYEDLEVVSTVEETDEDKEVKAKEKLETPNAFKTTEEELPSLDFNNPSSFQTAQSNNSLEVDAEEEEEELELQIVAPAKETKVSSIENYDPTLDLSSYKYPHFDLLNEPEPNQYKVTAEELRENKLKIKETLANYQVGIVDIKATIGPTVTLYEIIPEAGIRVSRVKNLEDDIAMSLAALGIRIIAPIPGKGTIGIEVPNKNRETVSLRSVMESEKFGHSKMELPVVLGKTISNEVFVVDLAKMPHLLMAGATGQGKSVGLNVLLNSLLYKKHPSQLKLILVDPKKVELSMYGKLVNHFLAKLPSEDEPIITDTRKVIHTLNSLCAEMDNRYDLLKTAGCRNLKEYNEKFIKRQLNPENGHFFMPYIVLVIDELADLMMTAGKEVETPIARLAQLARAVGIHLVVATQRPSVKIITGLIKANFPARLSFRVTSSIDSRTILDTGGADQLVGMGDMLFSNGNDLERIQCAYIDTAEVEAVVDFISQQRGYGEAYLLPEVADTEGDETANFSIDDLDSLAEEAAKMIVSSGVGSTSNIQRRMNLGYNRAGRIMDQLEALGIVGPAHGSKPREVLVHDEYTLEQIFRDISVRR